MTSAADQTRATTVPTAVTKRPVHPALIHLPWLFLSVVGVAGCFWVPSYMTTIMAEWAKVPLAASGVLVGLFFAASGIGSVIYWVDS